MERKDLRAYELEMVKINKGKKVKVCLTLGEDELYIHGGDVMQGEFRYIMHKAKNPRSEYQPGHENIHLNVNKGWFIVDPIRIVL